MSETEVAEPYVMQALDGSEGIAEVGAVVLVENRERYCAPKVAPLKRCS